MKIRNAIHRGLRRFIERNDASGLSPPVIEKVRNIVTFLQEMEEAKELRRIDQREGKIFDLDFEDYH